MGTKEEDTTADVANTQDFENSGGSLVRAKLNGRGIGVLNADVFIDPAGQRVSFHPEDFLFALWCSARHRWLHEGVGDITVRVRHRWQYFSADDGRVDRHPGTYETDAKHASRMLMAGGRLRVVDAPGQKQD